MDVTRIIFKREDYIDCVYVKVGGRGWESAWAVMYKSDYDRLKQLCISSNFFVMGGRSVSAKDALNRNLSVARVIMEADPGQIVRYKDGSILNLKRTNLYLSTGASQYNDCDRATEAMKKKNLFKEDFSDGSFAGPTGYRYA